MTTRRSTAASSPSAAAPEQLILLPPISQDRLRSNLCIGSIARSFRVWGRLGLGGHLAQMSDSVPSAPAPQLARSRQLREGRASRLLLNGLSRSQGSRVSFPETERPAASMARGAEAMIRTRFDIRHRADARPEAFNRLIRDEQRPTLSEVDPAGGPHRSFSVAVPAMGTSVRWLMLMLQRPGLVHHSLRIPADDAAWFTWRRVREGMIDQKGTDRLVGTQTGIGLRMEDGSRPSLFFRDDGSSVSGIDDGTLTKPMEVTRAVTMLMMESLFDSDTGRPPAQRQLTLGAVPRVVPAILPTTSAPPLRQCGGALELDHI